MGLTLYPYTIAKKLDCVTLANFLLQLIENTRLRGLQTINEATRIDDLPLC